MGKATAIGWTHHTFNPWWGCVKVDPLCTNCYASAFAKRTGNDIWGLSAARRFFPDKHWAEPLKWNAAALAAGERRRVFCASMADVFEDRADLRPHRLRLWKLIKVTPSLDWLLLTKRPENFERMLPWTLTDESGAYCGNVVCKAAALRDDVVCSDDTCDLEPGEWEAGAWPNVWLGVSAGTAKGWNERWPILKRTPAAVRFVSAEPLLEDIAPAMYESFASLDGILPNWIIVGGESGGTRRPMQIGWMEGLAAVATAAGVKLFVKQDTAFKAGQRGRISLPLWERKEFPGAAP